MANKTVEDIYGYAQDLLKFEGEDIGLPGMEEDRTIDFVNDLNKQLFEEFYAKGVAVPRYLASYFGFDTVSGTTLAAAASAGAVSLTIASSAALPTAGMAVIYDGDQFDPIQFSGNSAGSVTGVPATGRTSVKFAHESGLGIERLYPLPSDFGRMRPVKKNDDPQRSHDGVMVGGIGYRDIPTMPSYRSFSVEQNSSGSQFLWLPTGTSGQVMVEYDLAPTTLNTTASVIDWPDPYHMWLVYGLIALFKQVQDEDYVPVKETAEQMKIFNQAIRKRSAGKKILGNAVFFGRMR